MRLSDLGSDEYSQFGEDGILAEVFRRIGEGERRCVEAGAADGLSCSNTARLRRLGWSSVLVEPDPERFSKLAETVLEELSDSMSHEDFNRVRLSAWRLGVDGELDVILAEHDWDSFDLLSLDVDGAEFELWSRLTRRPRVVVVEYNQSVPPHVWLVQRDVTSRLGSSALALVRLGEQKGYRLIALTEANLIFVIKEELGAFADVERDLATLFRYEALSYLISDQDGRVARLGRPPWGVLGVAGFDTWPYVGLRNVDFEASVEVVPLAPDFTRTDLLR